MIVSYSQSLNDHVSHLRTPGIKVSNSLYVKIKKDSFGQTEILFLGGHWIGDGLIRMDGEKVRAIKEWDPPTKKKMAEFRSFLGLVHYYRIGDSSGGYSRRAAPLTDLLREGTNVEMDGSVSRSFLRRR